MTVQLFAFIFFQTFCLLVSTFVISFLPGFRENLSILIADHRLELITTTIAYVWGSWIIFSVSFNLADSLLRRLIVSTIVFGALWGLALLLPMGAPT